MPAYLSGRNEALKVFSNCGMLAPLRDKDLGEEASIDCLIVNGGLVSLDLRDDVTCADFIALLELPRRKIPRGHRRRQRRHRQQGVRRLKTQKQKEPKGVRMEWSGDASRGGKTCGKDARD